MRVSLSILCISLFTISILVISSQPAYGQQLITATSTGLDYSSILELENKRGNDFNIDSVRIWLGEDNSFKSFKTERGWIGKFEVGGQVIVFSSQENVKPGQSVKFGIKTSSENPVINWKALDSNDQVIQSAATSTGQLDPEKTTETEQPKINQPTVVAIDDDSSFRFIPDKPSVGSDFRIIGQNFVPNQSVTLYIANQMIKSIEIDNDGRFISTASVPKDLSADRIEFTLTDTGGSEKIVSIRIQETVNREISEDVKISIGLTPKIIKRGDTITLEGQSTPDTTLTLTTTQNDNIINIETFMSGFDGKWSYDHLFPIDLKLGKISIDITDGKTTVIRGFDIISSQLINITSDKMRYDIGDVIEFTGSGIPNENITIILEDPLDVEVFSKTFNVNDSGNFNFSVDVAANFAEGTYVLSAYQGRETSLSVIGVEENPESILIVKPTQLNYSFGSTVDLKIQGEPHKSVSLVIIDDSFQKKISDSIKLDDNGKYIYEVDSDELGTGAFEVEVRHGNSRGETIFTVGLSTGSGQIEFNTIRQEYNSGEKLLIIGNTGNNALLSVEIFDDSGKLVRVIETFSDKTGMFKVDNFRIPLTSDAGEWTINISSGENSTERKFFVVTEASGIAVFTQEQSKLHKTGQILTIFGKDAREGSVVFLTINNSDNVLVESLELQTTNSGDFYAIWLIPNDLLPGIYTILADDEISTSTTSFSVG